MAAAQDRPERRLRTVALVAVVGPFAAGPLLPVMVVRLQAAAARAERRALLGAEGLAEAAGVLVPVLLVA